MGIGYIILIAFGSYAAIKFYKNQQEIKTELQNKGVARPGVSYYQPLPVTHRVQQVQAYTQANSCQATQPGFAPAFGPMENIPASCQEWSV